MKAMTNNFVKLFVVLVICLVAMVLREQSVSTADSSCESASMAASSLKLNSGVQPGPDLETNPIIKWQYSLGTEIRYLDFQDGLVYVSGEGVGLVGLDPNSGQLLHSFEFGSENTASGLFTVADPYIIEISYSGDSAAVFLYELANQGNSVSSIWGLRYQGWIADSPFWGNDSIFLTHLSPGFSFVLGITSLAVEDGSENWFYRVPEEQLRRVGLANRGEDYLAASDRQLFLISPGIAVQAISRISGAECWVKDDIEPFGASIALIDDYLYVPSGSDEIVALNSVNGDEEWSESGVSVRSSPAVGNGQLYIGGQDGSLLSFGARSGDRKWTFEAGYFTRSEISLTDRMVYALSSDGYFYAISAGDGTLAWKLDTRTERHSAVTEHVGPRPLVVNGMVFVAIDDVLLALTAGTDS